MLTVYITAPGAKMIREGGVLKVVKDKDIYHTIFPHRTDEVVIFGGVEITSSAMQTLLKHGINTVFLNKNGRYNGRLVCPYDHNVLLRRMQYKLLDDETRCLDFCRFVARAKIRNQLTMLQRISRFQKRDLKSVMNQLKDLMQKLPQAVSIDSLRGYEGAAARAYFSVFDKGFIDSQNFSKRIRRPPTDPVNALLSFLYTLLFNRVDAEVERAGLDPYVGIFHTLGYARRSLALDLMEELRTPLVDTLVFSLFNLKIIDQDDFRTIQQEDVEMEEILPPAPDPGPDVLTDQMGGFCSQPAAAEISWEVPADSTFPEDDGHIPDPTKRPVLLKHEALKRVISQFERKLETSFHHEEERRNITYRQAFGVQVKQFIGFLRGEREAYIPLEMK